MTIKVGDKVRRKKEFLNYGWNESTRVLTVKEIVSKLTVSFEELTYLYDLDKFERVEEKPISHEEKLASLKSGDKIYICNKIVEFIGIVKHSGLIVYMTAEGGYSHVTPSAVKLVEEIWWVPVFKQGNSDEFPELGKVHFNSKKECDEKWKSHPLFIGSIRVDNEAPRI